MLKLRILTAVVMIPLVLWALFAWPRNAFSLFLGAFILVGAWEWTALCQIKYVGARLLYIATLVGAGVLFLINPSWSLALMGAAVLWWLWIFIEVLAYPDVHRGFLASRVGKLLSGFMVLLPAWIALPLLRELSAYGAWLALFLLLVVWAADTGAYFAGHRWGKTKLAPLISPGKTWEGVAGGLVLVLVLALATGLVVANNGTLLWAWVALALITGFVSVLGDLFESRLKRAAGVKDSGTLFPGHGGVLDRIDAFTAAAPLFTFACLWWHAAGGR